MRMVCRKSARPGAARGAAATGTSGPEVWPVLFKAKQAHERVMKMRHIAAAPLGWIGLEDCRYSGSESQYHPAAALLLKEAQPQSDEAGVLAAAAQQRMVAAALLRLDRRGCYAETICAAPPRLWLAMADRGFSRRIPASVRPELTSVPSTSRL